MHSIMFVIMPVRFQNLNCCILTNLNQLWAHIKHIDTQTLHHFLQNASDVKNDINMANSDYKATKLLHFQINLVVIHRHFLLHSF